MAWPSPDGLHAHAGKDLSKFWQSKKIWLSFVRGRFSHCITYLAMNYALTTSALFLCSSFAHAATLAEFDFATTTGTAAATISATSIVTGSGYSLSSFTGGAGLQGTVTTVSSGGVETQSPITAASVTGTDNTRHLVVRVGGTNATSRTDEEGAVSFNDYYGFTITPDAGSVLSLTSLTYDATRTGNFDGRIFLRSSLDGYNSTIHTYDLLSAPAALTNIGSISLPSSFSSLTSAVTFRFYFADNSASLTGIDTNAGLVYRIDNLKLEGTVPEPGSVLLIGMGALGILRRRRR